MVENFNNYVGGNGFGFKNYLVVFFVLMFLVFGSVSVWAIAEGDPCSYQEFIDGTVICGEEPWTGGCPGHLPGRTDDLFVCADWSGVYKYNLFIESGYDDCDDDGYIASHEVMWSIDNEGFDPTSIVCPSNPVLGMEDGDYTYGDFTGGMYDNDLIYTAYPGAPEICDDYGFTYGFYLVSDDPDYYEPIDNDGDGLANCNDPDCSSHEHCNCKSTIVADCRYLDGSNGIDVAACNADPYCEANSGSGSDVFECRPYVGPEYNYCTRYENENDCESKSYCVGWEDGKSYCFNCIWMMADENIDGNEDGVVEGICRSTANSNGHDIYPKPHNNIDRQIMTDCPGGSGSCTPTETPESTCDDGVDNDCDGDPDCTDSDCSAAPECSCFGKSDGTACATDGNPCTEDVCQSGSCVHNDLADGTVCTDDGNPCTEDVCNGGVCVHNSDPSKDGFSCGAACTDNNDDTLDVCCSDPNNANCNGGDPANCNGIFCNIAPPTFTFPSTIVGSIGCSGLGLPACDYSSVQNPKPNPVPVIDDSTSVPVSGFYGRYYDHSNTEADFEITDMFSDNPNIPFPKIPSEVNPSWYSGDPDFDRYDEDISYISEDGNCYFPINDDPSGNGNPDPHHFAVHWRACVKADSAGDYGFSISSDDDSWAYLDGVKVSDLGGLHPKCTFTGVMPLTTDYKVLDIFFAERHTVQSVFDFQFSDSNVDFAPWNPITKKCPDAAGDGEDDDTPVFDGCGDGNQDTPIEQLTEECDNGASNSDVNADACRTNCLNAYCGDGVVDSGEECDDGNNVDGDGCSSVCVIESFGSCSIDSVEWSKTYVYDGEQVELIVKGTGCDGKQVDFEIWEYDGGSDEIMVNGDDYDETSYSEPVSVNFVDGTATAVWNALWFDTDGSFFVDDPEYYFKAILNEDSSISLESGKTHDELLHVLAVSSSDAKWNDVNDNLIAEAKKGQAVRLRVEDSGNHFVSGDEIYYDIYRKENPSDEFSYYTSVSVSAQEDNSAYYEWTIPTNSFYYFDAGTTSGSNDIGTSENLFIAGAYNDDVVIDVSGLDCGSVFSIEDPFPSFDVRIEDSDALWSGEIVLAEEVIDTFSGEDFDGVYEADFPNKEISVHGSHSLKVLATNENSGKEVSRIVNFIVYDDVDETYVAACIDEPNFGDEHEKGIIKFNAASTSVVRSYKQGAENSNSDKICHWQAGDYSAPEGGDCNDQMVDPSSISFIWEFSDGRTRRVDAGQGGFAYDFYKSFIVQGYEGVSLTVEYS